MPYALLYGVPYETFGHLNPRKLEPFRKAKELEAEEKAKMMDYMAWLVGTYTVDAMGVWWGTNHNPYPETPRGTNSKAAPPDGEVMSDGAKFAAFVIEHNKKIRGAK